MPEGDAVSAWAMRILPSSKKVAPSYGEKKHSSEFEKKKEEIKLILGREGGLPIPR